jgi:hypothetical protein
MEKIEGVSLKIHGKYHLKKVDPDTVKKIKEDFRKHWSQQATESYKRIHSN